MKKNVIHPSSIVLNSQLGDNVHIGPFCYIDDSSLGDNVCIEGNTRIVSSHIMDDVEILWWSVVRESSLAEWCIIGCEIKKSHLGKKNKAKHIGTTIVNATTGWNVNFWSGFKCANYDGTGKWNFIIWENVFLGCNSVISVKSGKITTIHTGSKIGANVHIWRDVPPHTLVYIDKDTGKTTLRENYYDPLKS